MGAITSEGDSQSTPEASRQALYTAVLNRWQEYVTEEHPGGAEGGSAFWKSIMNNTISDKYLAQNINLCITMGGRQLHSHTFQLCSTLAMLRTTGLLPKQPNLLPEET